MSLRAFLLSTTALPTSAHTPDITVSNQCLTDRLQSRVDDTGVGRRGAPPAARPWARLAWLYWLRVWFVDLSAWKLTVSAGACRLLFVTFACLPARLFISIKRQHVSFAFPGFLICSPPPHLYMYVSPTGWGNHSLPYYPSRHIKQTLMFTPHGSTALNAQDVNGRSQC